MEYFDENDQDLDEMEEWGDDGDGDDLEDNSFVCEDCDYRWEEVTADEMDSGSIVCPMCGSVNVTQL